MGLMAVFSPDAPATTGAAWRLRFLFSPCLVVHDDWLWALFALATARSRAVSMSDPLALGIQINCLECWLAEQKIKRICRRKLLTHLPLVKVKV